jgi:protocatechuate 3,4-dioxygenase beta subunit
MRIRTVLKLFVVILSIAAPCKVSMGQGVPPATQGVHEASSRPPLTQSSPPPNRTHTGSLTGKVIDESGKAVVGAKVILTDSITQESSSASSGKTGKYMFSKLFPGAYTIHAEKNTLKSDLRDIKVNNENVATEDFVITTKQPK